MTVNIQMPLICTKTDTGFFFLFKQTQKFVLILISNFNKSYGGCRWPYIPAFWYPTFTKYRLTNSARLRCLDELNHRARIQRKLSSVSLIASYPNHLHNEVCCSGILVLVRASRWGNSRLNYLMQIIHEALTFNGCKNRATKRFNEEWRDQ